MTQIMAHTFAGRPPDTTRKERRYSNAHRARSWLLRVVCAAWMLAAGLLIPVSSTANEHPDPYRLMLIPSANTGLYREFTDSLTHELRVLAHAPIAISSFTPIELASSVDRNGTFPSADLIVPIGAHAAMSVATYSVDTPIYFALISENTYRSIVTRFRQNFPPERPRSALYLDHSLLRQLQFTHLIAPYRNTVGILLGPETQRSRQALESAARIVGVKIEIEHVQNGEPDIYKALSRLLDRADVILALPDPTVYNGRTIGDILLTTFRRKTPVIGFSRPFAKAGALAALYSTPLQMSQELAHIIANLSNNRNAALPMPGTPRDFSIDVNFWVAQSLNIDVPKLDAVRRRLMETFTPQLN